MTPHHVFVPENTFTDVFNNNCDISDFRARILCPQMTQKHNEWPPEQLPTDV